MKRFNHCPCMLAAALIAFSGAAHSQTPADAPSVVFRVDVVSRTTKAINYHHRQGSTTLKLEGSSFAPKAKGEVKVDSKTGATKVDASIEKMPPASAFGEGFLTYVLWAITSEGRAENMGELMLEGDRARLQAATELQTFGMIVTAEPYYAVTQPSDSVVMEAVVSKDTTGTIMPIETKFELVAKGGYLQYLPPADRVRLREAKNIPLDLMEARQAMAVARSAGAERYAADTIRKADVDLGNAEAFMQSGKDKKRVQTLARHVTQLAEDARLISVRKGQEDLLARERTDNERRNTELTRTAEAETERRRNAELETAQRNREMIAAQEQAALTRKNADEAQAQSAATLAQKNQQLAMESERARTASAQAEAERVKQQLFEMEAAKSRQQTEIAQRERDESLKKQQLLAMETARARESADASAMKSREMEEQARVARESAQRADEERTKMRLELVRQFNIVLATRETARGLIVNMSDVLFDTGRHTLKPGAREKLAKVAGIILAHPGLKIEVEGHTDSTGGPAINQPLSDKRADSVRTYLVAQGIASDTITSKGFGETLPVADNATAAGRQANRRVELVVSGSILSNMELSPTPSR